jgi:hypothetical protein
MSVRDRIRAKTVGAKGLFRNERVKLDDEIEVEIRQPSVGDRASIVDSAATPDENAPNGVKIDLAKLQVSAVLACAFVPDTDEKAFEEADRPRMLAAPAGGWFDDLAKVAMRMVNVDTVDAKNG